MRLALVALVLALPAATSAEAPTAPAARSAEAPPPRAAGAFTPSRICRDDLMLRQARSPEAAKARPLGELPPGDLTLAVVNRVGDCIEPVIVRQGVGGFDGGPGR